MSEFPRPLLALAFTSVAAVIWCIFYMFGFMPFGSSANGMLNFLLYIAGNLLWVIPVLLFFVGLNEYRRGYETRAYIVCAIGALLSLTSLLLLFL